MGARHPRGGGHHDRRTRRHPAAGRGRCGPGGHGGLFRSALRLAVPPVPRFGSLRSGPRFLRPRELACRRGTPVGRASVARKPCARLPAMRWLLVVGFERAADFGLDVRDELAAMGHEVRSFAYRRANAFYRNRTTKGAYQRLILRRLERLCLTWRPERVLVLKGGPITPELVRRVKKRTGALFLNLFPDNPLWMIPFECIEPYDLFFTKERYAMRQLRLVGLTNLHYLPLYCVPAFQHPVDLTPDEAAPLVRVAALVGRHYPYRERFVRELADRPVRV